MFEPRKLTPTDRYCGQVDDELTLAEEVAEFLGGPPAHRSPLTLAALLSGLSLILLGGLLLLLIFVIH